MVMMMTMLELFVCYLCVLEDIPYHKYYDHYYRHCVKDVILTIIIVISFLVSFCPPRSSYSFSHCCCHWYLVVFVSYIPCLITLYFYHGCLLWSEELMCVGTTTGHNFSVICNISMIMILIMGKLHTVREYKAQVKGI